MIPVSLWSPHLAQPRAHRRLPDGTPLNLTAAGVDFFERLTGHLLWPQDFREACIYLWVASLTEARMEELWTPQPPTDEDGPTHTPARHEPELAALARKWAADTIPPGAAIMARALAVALYNFHNETALEVDEAALDDTAEKKSQSAAPTGSSQPSTPSVAAIPAAGPLSFSRPHGDSSSPTTAHGSPPMESPSSPPPPGPGTTA